MTKAIAVTSVPWNVRKLDVKSGRWVDELIIWNLAPPAPGCCEICVQRHEPDFPHDVTSNHYRTAFHAMIGRPPTWADAMAHCTPDMRRHWRQHLREGWTAPPKGERPIAHYGIYETAPDLAERQAKDKGESA